MKGGEKGEDKGARGEGGERGAVRGGEEDAKRGQARMNRGGGGVPPVALQGLCAAGANLADRLPPA